MNNKTFMIILGVLAIGIGGFLVFSSSSETASAERLGTQYDEVGAQHVAPGQQTSPYNTVPATSGDHGERIPYGEYDRVLTDYEALHGLEHGGASFWYNPELITDEELAEVRATFESIDAEKKYLSARNDLPANVKLSMAAWTYLLEQEEVDTEEMVDFYFSHFNKGPELAP